MFVLRIVIYLGLHATLTIDHILRPNHSLHIDEYFSASVKIVCVLPLGGSRTGILNGARTVLYEAERGHMLIALCVCYSFILSPFVFIYEEDKVLSCLV